MVYSETNRACQSWTNSCYSVGRESFAAAKLSLCFHNALQSVWVTDWRDACLQNGSTLFDSYDFMYDRVICCARAKLQLGRLVSLLLLPPHHSSLVSQPSSTTRNLFQRLPRASAPATPHQIQAGNPASNGVSVELSRVWAFLGVLHRSHKVSKIVQGRERRSRDGSTARCPWLAVFRAVQCDERSASFQTSFSPCARGVNKPFTLAAASLTRL